MFLGTAHSLHFSLPEKTNKQKQLVELKTRKVTFNFQVQKTEEVVLDVTHSCYRDEDLDKKAS